MLHTLRFFFSSKCRLFHNATFFGSCIIHILPTGCAKIYIPNSGAKRLTPKCLRQIPLLENTLDFTTAKRRTSKEEDQLAAPQNVRNKKCVTFINKLSQKTNRFVMTRVKFIITAEL